jgi:hypothetical protein
MGLFDKFRKKVVPPAPAPVVEKKKTVRKKKEPKPELSAKDLATMAGEPYVAVLNVEIDKENIGSGAFELDWNDKFIASLVRAGYQVKANEPENEIVDRWFQTVCRNIALETYQQTIADPDNRMRIERKDIGNGRTEIS